MNKALSMLLLVVLIVGILAVAGFAIYDAWAEVTGRLAHRRLEAEVTKAEARAAEARAVADRTREEAALAAAMAEVTRAEGEADALRTQAEAGAMVIAAGAKTVNRQSFLFLFWGMLAPAGLAFTALCVLAAGFCIGMMVALGMTMAIKMGILREIKELLGGKDGEDSD